MRAFRITIYAFAAIALLTGTNDFLQGQISQAPLGAGLTPEGFADPLMDSVFRFFAALWFGTGVLFVIFVRDLDRYKPPMMALLGIVILGGIGRVMTIIQHGLPEHPGGLALVGAGLLAEVVVSPVLLWWLAFRHKAQG